MRWFITLCNLLLTPTARRFDRALDDPQTAQAQVQKAICDRLIASPYGQTLGIQSVADWSKVPIVEYDDLHPWIHACGSDQPAPGPSPLTPEPILFYEKTSGSRGPAKWIPYTRSLRQSFSRMFCVWAHDLISRGPSFRTGKLYFCISPQLGKTDSEPSNSGKTQLSDDSDYLEGWLQTLLSPFWITVPGLHQIQDPETFKHQLCLKLLAEEKLEIISIWSPSFLKVQLAYIEAHREALIHSLGPQLSPQRQALLRQDPIPWTQIWPELKLISCWDSANSADSADWLRQQFPGVLVQGKGLLATEAPMTVPLISAQGYVPVLDEVFFEFEDEAGEIYPLHELAIASTYRLILSQKGGLYRYRIGDRVRVSHYYRQTPCLEFLGREANTSDLVGEKLHEDFVRQAFETLGLGSSFKSLVPVMTPEPHYLLLLDTLNLPTESLAPALERELCRSPHYQHARLLGQLGPAQVLVSAQIPAILTQHHIQTGKTWGDIKYPLLENKAIATALVTKLQHAAIASVGSMQTLNAVKT